MIIMKQNFIDIRLEYLKILNSNCHIKNGNLKL